MYTDRVPSHTVYSVNYTFYSVLSLSCALAFSLTKGISSSSITAPLSTSILTSVLTAFFEDFFDSTLILSTGGGAMEIWGGVGAGAAAETVPLEILFS